MLKINTKIMRNRIFFFFCFLLATPAFGQLTSLVGIGVRLQIDSTALGYKAAKVISFIPGGPAEKSGLKTGDLVLKVDGKSAVKIPLEEVINLIKGPEGSVVKLDVSRGGVTKSYSMTRKSMQASNVYYTPAADTEFGNSIARLLNDAPYEFRNTIDSTTHTEEGTGFTRDVYPCRVKVPGVQAVNMVRSFGTTCRIVIGTYPTMDEVNKYGEEFVAELQKCFPKFYFFPVIGEKSNKVQIGNQSADRYTSSLMELYSYQDKKDNTYKLEMRVESGTPKVFYTTSAEKPDTDFAGAIHKIYGEVVNKFENLKGAEHQEGGPFNTTYWYDSNMEVPGSGKTYIYGGTGMIPTPLRFVSLFYNGPDKEQADAVFAKLADVVRDAFGNEFVFTFDKPSELIEHVIPKDAEKCVIFARRRERGYENAPVALLLYAPSMEGNYSVSLIFYKTAL